MVITPLQERALMDTTDDILRACKCEAWPPRPSPGGQHVGTGPSGIKLTHPTGITACVDTARSQHINRMIAADMILAALTHPRFQP